MKVKIVNSTKKLNEKLLTEDEYDDLSAMLGYDASNKDQTETAETKQGAKDLANGVIINNNPNDKQLDKARDNLKLQNSINNKPLYSVEDFAKALADNEFEDASWSKRPKIWQRLDHYLKMALQNHLTPQDMATISSDETLSEDEIIELSHDLELKNADTHLNPLFISLPGVGKTSVARKWADHWKLNLFYFTLAGTPAEDIVGLPGLETKEDGTKIAVKIPSNIFDRLDAPNSVLFLDELNRVSDMDIYNPLLQLVNNHTLPLSNGTSRTFDKMLFTVCAMNPSDPAEGSVDLPKALLDRVKPEWIEAKAEDVKDYLINKFIAAEKLLLKSAESLQKAGNNAEAKLKLEGAEAFKGRAAIAKKLFSSSDFIFTTYDWYINHINEIAKDRKGAHLKPSDVGLNDEKHFQSEIWNGITTVSRNVESVLTDCDGTKDDFLDKWRSTGNNLLYKKVEAILADYDDNDKDIDDGTDAIAISRTKANNAMGAEIGDTLGNAYGKD